MHDFIKCLTVGVIAFIMQIKPRREAAGSPDDGGEQLFHDPWWETARVRTRDLKVIKGHIYSIMLLFNCLICMSGQSQFRTAGWKLTIYEDSELLKERKKFADAKSYQSKLGFKLLIFFLIQGKRPKIWKLEHFKKKRKSKITIYETSSVVRMQLFRE